MEDKVEGLNALAVETVPNPSVELEGQLSALEDEKETESDHSTAGEDPSAEDDSVNNLSQVTDTADVDNSKKEGASSDDDDNKPDEKDLKESANESEELEKLEYVDDDDDDLSLEEAALSIDEEDKGSDGEQEDDNDKTDDDVEDSDDVEKDEVPTGDEESILDETAESAADESCVTEEEEGENENGTSREESGETAICSRSQPPVEIFAGMSEGPADFPLSQDTTDLTPKPLELSVAEMKRQRKASHKVIEMTETETALSQPPPPGKRGRKPAKGKKKAVKKNLGKKATAGSYTPVRQGEVAALDTSGTPVSMPSTPKGSKKEYTAELPDGWVVKAVQRMSGVSVGKYDIYYFSPQGQKFRSKNEIRNFCVTTGMEIDPDIYDFRAAYLVEKGILNLEGVAPLRRASPKPKIKGGVKKAKEGVLKKKALSKGAKSAAKSMKGLVAGDMTGEDQAPLQKLVIKMPFGGGFAKTKMTKKETSQITSYFAVDEDEARGGLEGNVGLGVNETMEVSEQRVTKVVKKGKKKKNVGKKSSKTGKSEMEMSPEKSQAMKRTRDEAFGSSPQTTMLDTEADSVHSVVKKSKKTGSPKKNTTAAETSSGAADGSQESLGFDVSKGSDDDQESTAESLPSDQQNNDVDDDDISLQDDEASVENEKDANMIAQDLPLSTSQDDLQHSLSVNKKRSRPKRKVNELDDDSTTLQDNEASLENVNDELEDGDMKTEDADLSQVKRRGRRKKNANKVEPPNEKKEEVSWEDYQKELLGLSDKTPVAAESKPEEKSDKPPSQPSDAEQEMEEDDVVEEEAVISEREEEELDCKKILDDAREYAKVPEEITADYILGNVAATKGSPKATKKKKFNPIITTRPKSKREDKWIPPHSPFCLVQESLAHDPWKLLVATILLDKNKGYPMSRQTIPILWKLLNRWPTAKLTKVARVDEMADILFPLGFNYQRAKSIKKFSDEFLRKKWEYPIELHGIGKYGNDSYRIFCIDEWKKVEPSDQKLSDYQHWLLANQKQLGLS